MTDLYAIVDGPEPSGPSEKLELGDRWVVPVEPCEHISIDYPNGHIDGHWVPSPNGTWCPGARIGGTP
jgi:hypothetical protein